MGILRISVEDRADVAATGAKLHLTVKGTAALLGNAAVKRAAEVRALVEALAQADVTEDRLEVSGVRLASNANLLGRSQLVTINLTLAVDPSQLPKVLGILAEQPHLTLDHLEWIYETFEASIPLTARAMAKARRKADAVAAAAGQRVTGIANASDTWTMPAPQQAMTYDVMSTGRASAASAEIDLGMEFSSTIEIYVQLTVDFEMGE